MEIATGSGTAGAAESKAIVNRLRRLEGQVRGLQSMIESGKPCEDVLTQVMAARSALNQVGLRIVARSMKECLAEQGGRSSADLIDEALELFMKYADCLR